jgi:AcrR family transcriptional regulator
MPRTQEQFGEIREQKKELIMNTALELFANEGYYPTSISRIADKAGISKGLMYNYFESKEDLILAIIERGLNELLSSLDPNRDGSVTQEEFEFHVNENFKLMLEKRDYWKLYFSTMMQPAVFKLVANKFNLVVPQVKSLMFDYFKRKGAEDPIAEASLFYAALDGIFINYFMDPDGFPLEKVRQILINKFK